MDGDLAKRESEVAELARFLKVLGNPWRLRILEQLAIGPQQVGDIEQALGLGQAYVSQQLARLRSEGVVEGERSGRSVMYRIVDARVESVLQIMHRYQTASQSGRVGKI